MALELRPNCECWDRDLPPSSPLARICTFECTFCADCVESVLHNVCPNCGGGFAPRPIRPATEWRPELSTAKRQLDVLAKCNIWTQRTTTMPGRSMHEDDPLEDFARRETTHQDVTKRVYVAGSGPAVIVMAEMPGISPHVARFARWVRDDGFTVIAGTLCGLAGFLLGNQAEFVSPAYMHWQRSAPSSTTTIS